MYIYLSMYLSTRPPWQQKRSSALDLEEDMMSMDQKKIRLQERKTFPN